MFRVAYRTIHGIAPQHHSNIAPSHSAWAAGAQLVPPVYAVPYPVLGTHRYSRTGRAPAPWKRWAVRWALHLVLHLHPSLHLHTVVVSFPLGPPFVCLPVCLPVCTYLCAGCQSLNFGQTPQGGLRLRESLLRTAKLAGHCPLPGASAATPGG